MKRYRVTVFFSHGTIHSRIVNGIDEESAFLRGIPEYLFREIKNSTIGNNIPKYYVHELTPAEMEEEDVKIFANVR